MKTPKYRNPFETTLNGKEDGGISLARQLIGRSSLLLKFSLYPEYVPNRVRMSVITGIDEIGFET